MMHSEQFRIFCRTALIALVIAGFALSLSTANAQPVYRTFSQTSLSEKKAKAGKATASEVCFTFFNQNGEAVNGLVARCNAHINSVDNSGGFTTVTITDKEKGLLASGLSVAPGDSVTICMTVDKKAPGTKISSWYWTKDGSQAGTKQYEIFPKTETRIYIQPNGGNALEYLYKRIVTRPAGIVLGTPRPDSALNYGWIRYMKADRKYFPHVGEPRCLDFIANGNGGQKPFVKELKNPHVKKHDNHFLGELHALKLAVLANDSGVTEPIDSLATALGDLIYNDALYPGDPFNGMTIRGIIALGDSALTYCANFDTTKYRELDDVVSRINRAFDGAYVAESFTPFLLAGTHALAEVPFLQPNPAVMPVARRTPMYSIEEAIPQDLALSQNYPNPFNPTTTIEFALPEAGRVTLKIYNMLGQEVATLLDESALDEGEQQVTFDAAALPSGVYLYRVTAQSADNARLMQQVKRMVLIK